MPTIYIDKSGHMEGHNALDRFFCVASVEMEKPELIERLFTAWLRGHFFRKVFQKSEIKFSVNAISPSLRLRTLKYISSLDIQIRIVYVPNEHIPPSYFDRNGMKSGHLYVDMVFEAIRFHCPFTDNYLFVFCDIRPLKHIPKSRFNDIIHQRSCALMPIGSIINTRMIDLASTVNIQIADWVVGAFAAHINEKPNGHEYWNAIAGKAQVRRYPSPGERGG